MDANSFITKLKADGSSEDVTDLDAVLKDYQVLLTKLSTTERGTLSVNVICTLCRNIHKQPQWCDAVDKKSLVELAIAGMREGRSVSNDEQRVKLLAGALHIHKFIVSQPLSTPPELVLKVSYMPFEPDTDNLLKDYNKIYWSILADRLTYIDRLKAAKRAIIKLLPKVVEDVLKILHVYTTVQFCKTVLLYLVKKIRVIYSDNYAKDLNEVYGTIFNALSKKQDLTEFKKVSEDELFELYSILVESVFVIVENGSKISFQDSPFDNIVRTCIYLIGHKADMFHCLQTLYLNSFCGVLRKDQDPNFTETVLTNLLNSCETSEKFYEKTMQASYPYLSQFLRVYIDYAVSNHEKGNKEFLTKEIQVCCLKLILYIMNKLKTTEQMLKCENCKTKTGLHDSLRLSFLVKNIINISLNENVNLNDIIPLYLTINTNQYEVLKELNRLGCVNHEKCFRKLQTDVHNTAISLNKATHNDSSIKLFSVYLKNELRYMQSDAGLKNMSRALFNKSICELDSKLYADALKNAYLSLILSLPEGINAEKHMSLVMDIKSKALKQCTEAEESLNEDQNAFQMLTVLDCCKELSEKCEYGTIGPLLRHHKFSDLLKHEFGLYAKLWPSVVPIGGVWKALLDLSDGKHSNWAMAEPPDLVRWSLYEVVLATPACVRTLHCDLYKGVVRDILARFDGDEDNLSPQLKIVKATLLLLQTEFDLADASVKYGWKYSEQSIDVDCFQASRTVKQEFEATRPAVRAVDLLTDVLEHLHDVPPTQWLKHSLQLCHVFIYELLFFIEIGPALQLAHICMKIAERVEDSEVYVSAASAMLWCAARGPRLRDDMLRRAARPAHLALMAAAAFYYSKIGCVGSAARLLHTVQAYILDNETNAHGNLDVAAGLCLDTQAALCAGGGAGLGALVAAHRHYLALSLAGSSQVSRRLATARARVGAAAAAARVCGAPCWRRARAAAAPSLPRAPALRAAALCHTLAAAHHTTNTQAKIDNLKHILDLRPSSDPQPLDPTTSPSKQKLFFTPKRELESVRDCTDVFKKTQTSPSLLVTVPAFTTPSFLTHDAKCQCYACQNPSCLIMALRVTGLEASAYFRTKELDIAANYFEGALGDFGRVDVKLSCHFERLKAKGYEKFVVDAVKEIHVNEFSAARIEILMEAAFFELSNRNYGKADEYSVRIHEIMEEMTTVDCYLKNNVSNLLVASAKLRTMVQRQPENSRERIILEMEGLTLSPIKLESQPKTPEHKPAKPPTATNTAVVKDEEIPKTKRRVIKLNMEDADKDTPPVKNTRSRKPVFKIPVPVTSKPVLEDMTPLRSRTKPAILISQPSDEVDIGDIETPRPKDTKQEFFTPSESDTETFFTPMTSVKTYNKKSLKKTIVKNLENEFFTPKCGKENARHNRLSPKPDKLNSKIDNLNDKSELNCEDSKNNKKDHSSKIKIKNTEVLNTKIDNLNTKSDKTKTKSDKTKAKSDNIDAKSDNPNTKSGRVSTNPADVKDKAIAEAVVPKKKVETGSLRSLKDRRLLKRATSPGKLEVDDTKDKTRTRRLRQPAVFSNDKKNSDGKKI